MRTMRDTGYMMRDMMPPGGVGAEKVKGCEHTYFRI
jgi:hypothetical protein